jgi:hypothetical protein
VSRRSRSTHDGPHVELAPAATEPAAEPVETLVADRYLDALLAAVEPASGVRAGAAPTSASRVGHRDAAPPDIELEPGLRAGAAPTSASRVGHRDAAPPDIELEPGLRDAALVLRHALVRVHPSFRFEERLAARLAAAARSGDHGERGWGTLIPFTSGGADAAPGPGSAVTGAVWPAPELARPDPWLDAILSGAVEPADGVLAGTASRLVSARRPLLVGGAITSAALSLAGVAWVAWRVARPGVIADIEGTA